MSRSRRASSTSVAPHALKNSVPPANVAVPKLRAGTLRPEPPKSRYSMSVGCGETRQDAASHHTAWVTSTQQTGPAFQRISPPTGLIHRYHSDFPKDLYLQDDLLSSTPVARPALGRRHPRHHYRRIPGSPLRRALGVAPPGSPQGNPARPVAGAP